MNMEGQGNAGVGRRQVNETFSLPPNFNYSAMREVHIYIVYHSVRPLVGTGTPPTPSPASECAPPAELKGGHTGEKA